MKPEKHYLVKQANKLVEARYSLTTYEQRIILMMISLIQPEDEDFKRYVIKVSDFISLVGLKGESAYSRIKNILRDLRAREVLIEKENSKSFLVTGWISSAEYMDEKGEIKIAFDPNLKPYLLNVREKFLSLKLEKLIQFKSSYTTRIYTLLKQYERIGKRKFELSELRGVFGLKDEYPVYGDFKRYTILPAQKELNAKHKDGSYKSDISFTFDQVKTGRKVTGIIFYIKKNKMHEDIVIGDNSVMYLTSYGISEVKAKELALKVSEDEILKCIDIFESKRKTGKVKEQGQGLLIHLVESGAGKKTKKEIEEENRKKLALDKRNKEKIKEKKEKLSKEYSGIAKNQFVTSLRDEEKEALLEDILKKYKGNSVVFNIIKKAGLECQLIGADILERIPNYEEDKRLYIQEKMQA